ncbi:putative Ig domain-containing protein [Flavitalea sp. BT771]|uniref:putative Ig domain-containing protein n=1 Tax=Flavitalea sp. BT771 TaxID=3063329 RepID=UPI0026E4390C|nr:putative Ig domain-containing protein [Flavitalea sp. BT771]MDO6431633.1 putative Ig domain-containing protein [Flavitalea sp. BT771]MDV6220541.1 putative Ig domain-containing protein [Flavitalea sp. BT771]
MNRSTLFPMMALFCAHIQLHAQNNFWNDRNAYLGEPLPSDTPRVFAPGRLADTSAWAGDRIAFSPDGKEFYFSHNTEWFSHTNLKVKYMKFDNGKWNGPFVLNTQFYAPTFSMDGKTLYFLRQKGEVYRSSRTSNGWTEPEIYLKMNYGLYDYMPVRSGISYAGSNAHQGDIKDWSTYDFCTFSIKGKDTVIASLGVPLNTPGFDGDFFIAPDESFMVLSAKETKEFQCELYISYRKPDKTWTNPKSLGPLINNGLAHRWGEYVTPDNKYLFYTRGTGPKSCFIYWVRFDRMLENLRHTNFEPYVSVAPGDQETKMGQSFRLQIPERTFMDDDGNQTLTWSAGLDNGSPLPSWLKFDPATKVLAGTPMEKGTYTIRISATDTANAAAACHFTLQID